MTSRALVLTYHAVEEGEGPLFLTTDLLAEHLDVIVSSGLEVVTISGLASGLRDGLLSTPSVAITFDDGAASVARVAAPLLADRGLRATVFCVAGHLGASNDWPSARSGSPTFELASADELAELAGLGWEIGCHGMTHAPLDSDDRALLTREVIDAAVTLEELVGAEVTSFAYPYGAGPTTVAAELVASRYSAACSTSLGVVDSASDIHALPRVDAHYVRRPRILRAALAGSLGLYLRTLRLGAGARRVVRTDYLRHTDAKGHG